MNQTPASQLPGQVIAVNYNGTYYYYLRNAQGDVVKLIDKTGSTVVEYTYDSWGKLLSTTGSLAETFGAEQPFRYRGYVYDEETGWYYLQSRYYNPELGRFISADVYLSTGQGVLGHNAYAYCLNNPANCLDECGCFATIVIGGVTLSFAGLAVLFACSVVILDLLINQEASLISVFLSLLSDMCIQTVEDVTAVWNTMLLKDPDPYKRPGQKKQGRELKTKARKDERWKPKKKPRPLKHHTPGRDHRKYGTAAIYWISDYTQEAGD